MDKYNRICIRDTCGRVVDLRGEPDTMQHAWLSKQKRGRDGNLNHPPFTYFQKMSDYSCFRILYRHRVL